ncbi:helix-turn-helix domain-containing protein [Candidatus Marinimicrobia bacterium PRS2]|nr:helix-turn-helix domain-containing protein [Candidatus Marinimicrobia bacterium PRS2]
MEKTMTIKQIADYLQINRRKVYDEIALGRLTAFKIGRQYRVMYDSLMKYVQLNKVEY